MATITPTTTAGPSGDSRPLRAAAWMAGAIVSFTLMAVAGRHVQTEMNSFELMAWRSTIGVVVVSAILMRRGFAEVRTAVPWLHLRRNVFHFAGQNLWFTGLMMIRAHHAARGNPRTKILIPESAHGTNPASSALCGYQVVPVGRSV